MSQPQLNDFSPHLPACWGNSNQNAAICECCVQAELQPAYHVLRMGDLFPHRDSKAVDGSEFSFSSSITGSTCSPRTSLGSTSPNHFAQTQVLVPTDSDKADYNHDILVPIAEDSDGNHTPSTVPDSRGHTPPPMQTPPNMSFSNHLAYIDQKLADHVSSLAKRQFPNHTPRFPPGLTPRQNAVVPLSQRPTLVQMEQQFITYPQSRSLSGVRRTRSKMLRDESEPTPPETDALDPSNEADQESDAKRRACVLAQG
ncbi:hypothetical protein FRC12_023276 [Ceratobasidium sp. 428]|nr:hypothetical protein FRC12_023276 [Ceratobasidium sp. 428]